MSRSLDPDAYGWGLTEALLAAAVDALNGIVWQNGGDPKAKRPKPIPRPGVKDESTDRKFGSGARSTTEIDEILGAAQEG